MTLSLKVYFGYSGNDINLESKMKKRGSNGLGKYHHQLGRNYESKRVPLFANISCML